MKSTKVRAKANAITAHPLVADVLRHVAPVANGPIDEASLKAKLDGLAPKDTHAANLLALAAAVLATSHLLDDRAGSSHPLDDRAGPGTGAEVLVERVHELRDRLLPDVASLLSDVRDRVALEDGRRAFVTRARSALQAVEALSPNVLDLRDGRVLTLGGQVVPIPYKRRTGARSTRAASVANKEGRLLLAIAAGRGPRRGVTAPVIVSRVRAALESLPSGVQLCGDPLRLEPAPKITPRAHAAAERLRTVADAPF